MAVVDLAGEMFEEAVELVEVAVGGRQELRRVNVVARLGPPHVDQLEHELIAEPLGLAGDADDVAAVEATGDPVGVAEHASGHGSGPIAELEGEVGRAGSGRQPVLARAGEDGVDVVAGAHGGERRWWCHGCCHVVMMYGESDAAAAMGIPARRITRSGAAVRVQGLERRRRCRIERDYVRGQRADRPPLRHDRSGGVLRLPGHPSADQADRGARAPDRVARGRAV